MNEDMSNFMATQVARLCNAFGFSYSREKDCVEYQIFSRRTGDIVSRSLVFSINRFSKMIHVSRFYPELNKQPDTHYLSAATFYLLIHHMGQLYGLNREYGIFLQCQTAVFHQFYEKLKDFDLLMLRATIASSADIAGTYRPSTVDTALIMAPRAHVDSFTGINAPPLPAVASAVPGQSFTGAK